jgi:uncharacterized protein (TIGR03083 family)
MRVDQERAWQVIEQQRRAIADLLADVTTEQWDSPSLCAGWRIRDVAAHLTLAAQPPTIRTIIGAFTRTGGRYNAMIDRLTVGHANRPGTDPVADIRQHAASRTLPAVTNYRNILFDVIVHGQDIAIPLGRTITVPTDAAAAGATRVWTMGWPFWARHRLAGFQLTATDVDWTVGRGVEIRGPIVGLLLLVTGRPAALDRLTGDGVPAIAHRLR